MSKAGCCFCLGVLAIPAIILGIMIGVYYPKAPNVTVSDEKINNFQVQGMILNADVNFQVTIRNNNVFPLTIQPMNITVAFPDAPNEIIGEGLIVPGTIAKSSTAIRHADIVFSAPFQALGFNFLKSLQTGTTKLLVRTKARGEAPFLAQRARFTSNMDCTITYYWDSRDTDRTCSEKHTLET